MTTESDRADPKGLIAESYRIEGIGMAECRSIFLGWVLSLPGDEDPGPLIPKLLARHGAAHPHHPMTCILQQGLAGAAGNERGRGRAGARRRGDAGRSS